MNYKDIILIISILVNIILGILLFYSYNQKEPEQKVVVEYINKTDTVNVEKERIVEKTKIKSVSVKDTFYVQLSDTINDTLYVTVPIEHKHYSDTIKNDSSEANLDVFYHGAFADLDSISLKYNYYNTKETIIKEPKKIGIVWSVGPCVGFGGVGNLSNGSIGYGPFVGVSGSIGIGGFIK